MRITIGIVHDAEKKLIASIIIISPGCREKKDSDTASNALVKRRS